MVKHFGKAKQEDIASEEVVDRKEALLSWQLKTYAGGIINMVVRLGR